ncbi:MAG: hypothetical protein RR756_06155 [Cetobacterium sp.]
MINREIGNFKNNSMIHSPSDDLTYENYMALAYCIAGIETKDGIKYPNRAAACKAFNVGEDDADIKKPRKKHIYNKNGKGRPTTELVAKNVFTGEVKKFIGLKSAAKYTQQTTGGVSYYLYYAKKEAYTKTGWRFELLGQEQIYEIIK